MVNLNTVELKAFIPSKDFTLSKRFYADLGFSQVSVAHGVAYFHCGVLGTFRPEVTLIAVALTS